MSFSGVGGGFQGGNALLAFAAVQQGRMNEEMTESMRIADLRSQMAGDLGDLKAHLDEAIRYPEQMLDVDKELQAFMEKYGEEPALAEVTSTVAPIAESIHGRALEHERSLSPKSDSVVVSRGGRGGAGWSTDVSDAAQSARAVLERPLDYDDETVKNWIDQITSSLDASGTNDQLAMIHIKQLNDNINNSSGMVSGIIESRSNAMSSIINNIA